MPGATPKAQQQRHGGVGVDGLPVEDRRLRRSVCHVLFARRVPRRSDYARR